MNDRRIIHLQNQITHFSVLHQRMMDLGKESAANRLKAQIKDYQIQIKALGG